MAEFQACSAGLDSPCSPRPKSFFTVTTAQHPNHTTRVVSIEEERGAYAFDCGRGGGGASPRQPPLKRARLEDDESSISLVDIATSNETVPPFLHHHHHHHHHVHHHPVVDPAPNFSPVSAQQQLTPEPNGHPSPSGQFDGHFGGGDHHMISESSQHAGLVYTQISGPGLYPGGVNIAEVLAELERERRKNAELLGKVCSLEAKLTGDDRQGTLFSNGSKKSKILRRVDKAGEVDEEETRKMRHHITHQAQAHVQAIKQEEELVLNVEVHNALPLPERCDTVVNWMIREEVTSADLEKLNKDVSEREESVDSDDDDEDEDDDDDEYEEDEEDGDVKEEERDMRKRRAYVPDAWKATESPDGIRKVGIDVKEEMDKACILMPMDQEDDDTDGEGKRKRRRKKRKEGKKTKRGDKTFFAKRGFGHELVSYRGPGIMSAYKKAPKTAFCPKEVKRIMESGVLGLKNAQSHTMRKIIVFASLGIRHGCEDLYELDFNHFSIVRRGEPYKSPKDPGEHVLYDHAGVRTKMFYPNRQNPILCPVRILEEEKSMRPAGPSCPSCLFLCIKYGGRTRNLPQNEYVRQRMGRNKLKSFGPLMCQMALLVHIRTGSFFFKALGITLLFMAGFPDDLVRKETKYRNLDLLHKYYRSDDDAKGEQLFHPYPAFFPQAMMVTPAVSHKTSIIGTKPFGKKGPPPLLSKPPTTPRYLQPLSARPALATMHGPPSTFPPVTAALTAPSSSGTTSGTPSPPGPPPPPYGVYSPYHLPLQRPPGGFAPMPVWPSVNSFTPPGAYPAPPYVYQPFSHSPQYSSQPFYVPPYGYPPFSQPQGVKKEKKKEADETDDSDSESESSSSGVGQKSKEKGNSSDSKAEE